MEMPGCMCLHYVQMQRPGIFFVCSLNLAGVSAVLCPALRALVKMTAGARKCVCGGSRL